MVSETASEDFAQASEKVRAGARKLVDALSEMSQSGTSATSLHSTFGNAGSERSSAQSCGCQENTLATQACGLCPWCRGAEIVGSIKPETLESMAKIAGTLAMTLQGMAHTVRDQKQGTSNPASENLGADNPEPGQGDDVGSQADQGKA